MDTMLQYYVIRISNGFYIGNETDSFSSSPRRAYRMLTVEQAKSFCNIVNKDFFPLTIEKYEMTLTESILVES